MAVPVEAERGQATVELAVLLPLIILLVLVIVQIGLVVGDRLAVLETARVGARAAALSPDDESVTRALDRHGIELHGGGFELSGRLRPGGIASITVTRPPTRLAIVGRFLGTIVISESLTFRVEDPDTG